MSLIVLNDIEVGQEAIVQKIPPPPISSKEIQSTLPIIPSIEEKIPDIELTLLLEKLADGLIKENKLPSAKEIIESKPHCNICNHVYGTCKARCLCCCSDCIMCGHGTEKSCSLMGCVCTYCKTGKHICLLCMCGTKEHCLVNRCVCYCCKQGMEYASKLVSLLSVPVRPKMPHKPFKNATDLRVQIDKFISDETDHEKTVKIITTDLFTIRPRILPVSTHAHCGVCICVGNHCKCFYCPGCNCYTKTPSERMSQVVKEYLDLSLTETLARTAHILSSPNSLLPLVASYYCSEELARLPGYIGKRFWTPRNILGEILGQRILSYIILACVGEARHGTDYIDISKSTDPIEIFIIRDLIKFAALSANNRKDAWGLGLVLRKYFSDEKILASLMQIFSRPGWSRSMGGIKWCNIANLGYQKASGEISYSLLADMSMNMVHNSSWALDKWYTNSYYKTLNDKKHGNPSLALSTLLDIKRRGDTTNPVYLTEFILTCITIEDIPNVLRIPIEQIFTMTKSTKGEFVKERVEIKVREGVIHGYYPEPAGLPSQLLPTNPMVPSWGEDGRITTTLDLNRTRR